MWTASPSETLKVARGFSLPHLDPSSTPGYLGGRDAGRAELKAHADELAMLQEKLYAQSKAERHPQRAAGAAGHGHLGQGRHHRARRRRDQPAGRAGRQLQEADRARSSRTTSCGASESSCRGRAIIGVFDRSHYEDVLIGQGARSRRTGGDPSSATAQIVEFERELTDSGTTIVKVMLHIGAGEQKKRLADRLNRAGQTLEIQPGRPRRARRLAAYREAYQLALERTSTDTRRGTRCPQTTSGTRVWRCSACCWMHWAAFG